MHTTHVENEESCKINQAHENISRWPLGIRLEVLPGATLIEQFANAARYGYDAVELPGRFLPEYRDELLAHHKELALPISSISLGYRGSLITADAQLRARCRQDIKDLCALCGKLGAVGLVIPPILHMNQLPRISAATGPARLAAEDRLMLEQLPELADCATGHGVNLLLEPVNQYETDYLNNLSHAAALCRALQHPAVGITADAFHMQMEELTPVAAIKEAGGFLKHVHIAENTRIEPGPGNLNFSPLFAALKDIGYDGYIVTECRTLSGPADQTLPHSAQYIHTIIDRVEP